VQIRGQRLETIGGPTDGGYADPDAVREEIAQARLAFDRLGLPVIDVTRRSIEETAAQIRQMIGRRATP
jgi:regulator of PEP synthase PpsR (kinase-PPPase family)